MRSDARKRMHPAPHWDPTVARLIEDARADERAPFEALAEKFEMWARLAGDQSSRSAYYACAGAMWDLMGGAS